MEKLSDAQLVEQYRAGDNEAIKFLISRHVRSIYNFIYRFAGNSHDAEDITQEAFVKVWRHIAKYDPQQEFRGWLFAIARNTALDWLRKKRPLTFADFENETGENALADTLVDPALLPNELAMQTDDTQAVNALLGGLSPRYREVLALRYNDQLTFDESSKKLGSPLDTVKSQSRRALIALKKLLSAPKGKIYP